MAFQSQMAAAIATPVADATVYEKIELNNLNEIGFHGVTRRK
jgi:hypothetical protein